MNNIYETQEIQSTKILKEGLLEQKKVKMGKKGHIEKKR